MALRTPAFSTTFKRALPPDERRPKKICSVWPEDLDIPHDGRHYTVPGISGPTFRHICGSTLDRGVDGKQVILFCGRTKKYGFMEFGPDVEKEDGGEGHTISVEAISSRRHALSVIELAEAGFSEISGLSVAPPVTVSQFSEKGLFVPVDDEPTDEELLAAEKAREKWFDVQIDRGDRAWNQSRNITNVPGEAVIAARFRNLDRPWAPAIRTHGDHPENSQCPACRAPINRGARKCATCAELLAYDEAGIVYWPKDPERQKEAAPAFKMPPVKAPPAEVNG